MLKNRLGDIFPQGELHPLHYQRLPRFEELRRGENGNIKLVEKALQELKLRGVDLSTVDQNVLCEKVLRGLHCNVDELPGVSMACYWLWCNALDQAREGKHPDPSLADIYAMLCAMQRNQFRLVLQKAFERESDIWSNLLRKAGFAPEDFRSTKEWWNKIRIADEAIDSALTLVRDALETLD